MYRFQTNRGKEMEQRKFNQPNRNQEWGEKRNKETIGSRKHKVR